MKSRNLKFLVMAAALLMVMVTSCSKSIGFEAMIPADSDVVIKLDMEDLLENAGVRVEQGNAVLTDNLSNALSQSGDLALVREVLSYADGLDLDCVYSVVRGRTMYLMAGVDDKAKVKANFEAICGAPQSIDGYECYTSSEGVYAYLVNNMLLVSGSKLDINAIKQKAKEESIASVGALAEFISESDDVNLAVNISKAGIAPEEGSWLVGRMDFEGNEAEGIFEVINADGKRYPFGEAFGIIDTDFLRYVPADAQVVAGIGRIESDAIKTMLGMLARNYPMSQLITDIDGTIGMAAVMPEDMNYKSLSQPEFYESLLQKAKVLLMVHYPQDVIQGALSFIRQAQGMNGAQVQTFGADGIATKLSLSEEPMDFYAANADGNLAVANYPFNANEQNSFTPVFQGKRAALYTVSRPNEMSRSYGVDFGSTMSLQLENDCVKGELKLVGTNKNLMEAIIEVMCNPAFRAEMEKVVATEGNLPAEDEWDNLEVVY